MFIALYTVHWLSSVFFALLTTIITLLLPDTPKHNQRRRQYWSPTGFTLVFGILTALFGLYYLVDTIQIGDGWAIGSLISWSGALYLLWRHLRDLTVRQFTTVKLLLTPITGFGSYLSIQRPATADLFIIFGYALMAVLTIAVWRHINLVLSHAGRLTTRFGIIAFLTGALVLSVTIHQRQSILPPIISMNATDMLMTPGVSMHSVDDYISPPTAARIDSFDITASAQTIHLSSGAVAQAWTFGDVAPTLHVTQGDLVEVKLTNHLSVPTTIHWHGIDIPNAEDGVAGITQNAVLPGASFIYHFIAKDTGTYWYHSHQDTSVQVPKGLFGTIVVDPSKATGEYDQTIALHTWDTNAGQRLSFNMNDTITQGAPIAAGTHVRLRVTNTDSNGQSIQLLGVPFRVAALDGRDLTNPGLLTAQRIELPAGGRADLTFMMPRTPIQLATLSPNGPALVYNNGGTSRRLAPQSNAPLFDMTQYGKPTPGALTVASHFNKSYEVNIDNTIGFFDGQFLPLHTINDKLLPYTKMLMVHQGDFVKLTFRNRTVDDHPMHLHGHHFTVLSHNGRPYTGSSLQLDTLQVKPGDVWEVAFIADNPGIWMSHCHNLTHAAQGMDLMITYDNVMTPYTFGSASLNRPE